MPILPSFTSIDSNIICFEWKIAFSSRFLDALKNYKHIERIGFVFSVFGQISVEPLLNHCLNVCLTPRPSLSWQLMLPTTRESWLVFDGRRREQLMQISFGRQSLTSFEMCLQFSSIEFSLIRMKIVANVFCASVETASESNEKTPHWVALCVPSHRQWCPALALALALALPLIVSSEQKTRIQVQKISKNNALKEIYVKCIWILKKERHKLRNGELRTEWEQWRTSADQCSGKGALERK